MKKKTNFDKYLEEQLRDCDFATCYKKAGDAWDVAMQLGGIEKRIQIVVERTGAARGYHTATDQPY